MFRRTIVPSGVGAWLLLACALASFSLPLAAQQPTENDRLTALEQQLQQLRGDLASKDGQIKQLQSEVQQLRGAERAPVTGSATPAAATTAAALDVEVKQLKDRVDALTENEKKTTPGQFNPAIGLVGETLFGYNTKGKDQTGNARPGGFDAQLRSAELSLSASVDPFARAYAVLNASADAQTGEATAAVEEASLVTTSLPANLTLQGGRFFADFGRLASRHDHELPFVNRPLVLDSYLGGESRTDGLQLNWLLPVEHYVSLTVGVGNGFGDPVANPGAYRAGGGLSYWGHLSTYFTPTSALSIEPGISGLITPREADRGGVLVQADGSTATEQARRVLGADLTLRYEPLEDNQFRSYVWGTEALLSDVDLQLDPDGSLNPANGAPGPSGDENRRALQSYGFYSYLAAKLNREWTVGTLYDQLQDPVNNQASMRAYSLFATWNVSHFQMLRLQVTHTVREDLPAEDAIFLQWVWIMGSHAHGFSNR